MPMIKIDLKMDIAKVKAMLAETRREITDKAVPRALNKLAEQAKTLSSKEIRSAGYTIKAKTVKEQIVIVKATASTMTAIVKVRGKPVPLMEFNARQTKAGVSVKVKGARKVIKGAFIATMPTGHVGVFTRTPSSRYKRVRKGTKTQWTQLPIKELYGPSLPAIWSNQVIQAALLKMIKQKFPEVLRHEIEFLRLKLRR